MYQAQLRWGKTKKWTLKALKKCLTFYWEKVHKESESKRQNFSSLSVNLLYLKNVQMIKRWKKYFVFQGWRMIHEFKETLATLPRCGRLSISATRFLRRQSVKNLTSDCKSTQLAVSMHSDFSFLSPLMEHQEIKGKKNIPVWRCRNLEKLKLWIRLGSWCMSPSNKTL